MKHKITLIMGLCLMFVASGYAVNFTRDSGDTNWSNLDQWNDNSSGSYQNSTIFPTSGDLVLLNAGKTVTVDTNASINIMVAPNATSDAVVELVAGGMLTANQFHVGNSSQAGNGTVNHFAGSLMVSTLSLRPTETKTGIYNLFGGTVSAAHLEIGNSATSASGTSTFVQSGGTVISPDVTIGGSGSGTVEISGGSFDATGPLDIINNGQLKVVGSSAIATADSLDTEPGSTIAFKLDAFGVATVQVSGNADLADVSITVDGSSYWGGATNFTLLESGSLVSLSGSISISGLVSASVSQVGSSVVLNVVESKTTALFEDTMGDGLWNTAGNWSPVGVPSGAVLARIDDGLTVTISTNPPAVDGIIVGSNATLVVQAELTATELRFEEQGILQFDLAMIGLPPVTVAGGVTWDPSGQITIDGNAYEGLDGYFPLILASNLPASMSNATFTGFGQREPALVVQADGLWLRVISPPALSERLCSLVPDSTVAPAWSNTVFSASRAYEPSGSAWSLSLDEGHVLDTRLSQADSSNTNCSWDLRTGRGGFTYSLRNPVLGETVPPSYRSSGDTSPWNDEVWQGVAVSDLNDPPDNPYFMHQSGVYLKDPALTKPFYSPQVASYLDVENRTFTTVNWTPQAHINIYTDGETSNDWKSYLLMYTRYRDLGQGVIEVSLGYYNYGPDLLNFLNMPWGGVRRTSMEYAFVSQTGGGWDTALTNGFGPLTIKFKDTGGWIGYSASTNGSSPAMAMVYGEDHATRLPQQRVGHSTLRPGYAGGTFNTNESNWRNYFVTSIIRWYNLTEGNGLWSRYYFAFGDDLSDLEARIANRGLVEAQLAAFDYTESASPLVAYRTSGNGADFQIMEDGSSPDFFFYAHPVRNSVPVFEIIEDDENRYLTWNPYANGIVKPYDGTIAGMRLLGFAMPTAGTSGTYATLEGLIPSANYMADGKTLSVRTATSIETWRVEHFGFTDDAGSGANTANPDSDELNNLGEYAFGGNPTNGADIGYVPTAGVLEEGATNWFEYVHARRKDSGSELSYVLETTSNLISNDWNVADYTELPITGTLDPDFEAVTNRIDTAGKTNEFIRLNVESL